MSDLNNSGFILEPKMYSQEEWYEMYIKVVEEYLRLEQEIERLQDMDKILRNENINLKLRINKAIEYIEENSDDMHTYISQVLTSILKGSDKE